MAEIEIIGLPQSDFVWATRIVLAEKGIPHRMVSAQPHSREVSAIHPFGKVPAMRHGDFTLAESRAICAYADRLAPEPPLWPADAREAAQAESWASMIVSTVEPLVIRQYLFAYMFPGTPDGGPDRDRIDASLPKMEAQLAVLEDAVASGAIGGGPLRLADAYLTPILFYLGKSPESAAMLAGLPALTAYLDRQLKRASVRETMPAG